MLNVVVNKPFKDSSCTANNFEEGVMFWPCLEHWETSVSRLSRHDISAELVCDFKNSIGWFWWHYVVTWQWWGCDW